MQRIYLTDLFFLSDAGIDTFVQGPDEKSRHTIEFLIPAGAKHQGKLPFGCFPRAFHKDMD